MPRPSRNLDRLLIAAGRELLPATGCAGLTIRQVAEAAGVNIGMFHYHFGSREVFLRAVLQETYEEMFRHLTREVMAPLDGGPVEHLRGAFRLLGRFLRDNHRLIGRVWADAMCGDPVARDFLKDNIPRHAQLLLSLIAEGQKSGVLRPMPLPQALAFCAGSILAPLLLGGAMARSEATPKAAAKALAATVLGDAGLDERIDLALAALALPAKPASVKRLARPRKKGPA